MSSPAVSLEVPQYLFQKASLFLRRERLVVPLRQPRLALATYQEQAVDHNDNFAEINKRYE